MSGSNICRVIAVLMLAGIGLENYLVAHQSPDVQAYLGRIRDSAHGLPARFGAWIGTDIPVPAQAVTVLKPNVMLSRYFVNVENGSEAGLVLVHCGDTHDMVGHFPLRCYPARGWEVVDSRPHDWTIGKLVLTGMEYRFHHPVGVDSPREQSITIINCLFRPGGRVLRDMDAMTRTIVGAGDAASGAGQIQIYFAPSVDEGHRDAAVVDLVKGCQPVIEAILAEPHARHAGSGEGRGQ